MQCVMEHIVLYTAVTADYIYLVLITKMRKVAPFPIWSEPATYFSSPDDVWPF